MSLTKKELRKQVGGELYEGWKAIRRATELLKHNDSRRKVILIVGALAQRTTEVADDIDSLLAE